MNRYYRIYPIEDINTIDWSQYTQTPETCLKSVDNTQFIVQFKYRPRNGELNVLTHEEAMTLKHSVEWKDPNNEGLI